MFLLTLEKECSLENVGKVADITGGEVEIVDPTQIASNFASILQKPVIATNGILLYICECKRKRRVEREERGGGRNGSFT